MSRNKDVRTFPARCPGFVGRPQFVLTLTVAGLIVAGIGYARQTAQQVFYNGKPMTKDVLERNGRLYVPLNEVARALNMTIVHRADGYELAPEGGANQLNGVRQGKIGDRLITPKWVFEVRGFHEAEAYTEQRCQDKKTLTPRNPGDTLLIVDCRLANGVKSSQTPILSERMAGNTALADAEGQSYAPLDFDARQLSGKFASYEADPLLPGAQSSFALVFSIPKNTRPKALVFSLLAYPNDVGRKETTDVRVTLAE